MLGGIANSSEGQGALVRSTYRINPTKKCSVRLCNPICQPHMLVHAATEQEQFAKPKSVPLGKRDPFTASWHRNSCHRNSA
jgi:hypothetical protein